MLTFLQLARKVLEEEKQPLTTTEIWGRAEEKGYTKDVNTKGKTPTATLAAQLYVDVRDNQNSPFIGIGARPKRFVLRVLAEQLGNKVFETVPKEPVKKSSKYLEKDLHPYLVYYGFYYLKAYLKTITHNRSGKKAYGEWVHPDIVGCYFPFHDWTPEVVEVSSMLGNPAIKLFSFELKRELSITNLRESFFQAVSNSSWATEGYLAAAEIDEDEDFISELKRLSSAFGIGIIKIDVSDPDGTEIIIPARTREVLDWETINKLAGMNTDFQEFLVRVKNDTKSREIRKELYDPVSDKDTLLAKWEKHEK